MSYEFVKHNQTYSEGADIIDPRNADINAFLDVNSDWVTTEGCDIRQAYVRASKMFIKHSARANSQDDPMNAVVIAAMNGFYSLLEKRKKSETTSSMLEHQL